MADRKEKTKTTSSKSLDGKAIQQQHDQHSTSASTPKGAEVQLMQKLAENLSESYQLVKRRQQKYNEITAGTPYASTTNGCSTTQTTKTTHNDDEVGESGGDWQEVCSSKNKLKRKKQLSASLTSVNDSVNQEKRTRIEGIQLNCRGKLPLRHGVVTVMAPTAAEPVKMMPVVRPTPQRGEKLPTKPPLPPQATKAQQSNATQVATPPPRLKRKLQENIQKIQKLNTLTEQLRLEINELKSNLNTERSAVRVLRAQNESETRKWKNELKKLQNALELSKKSSATLPINNTKKSHISDTENRPTTGDSLSTSQTTAGLVMVNHEIQRLTNEIIMLKEANKALEEKKLLEEIKTKDRTIGQLKKDVHILQNKTHSRNATTHSTTSAPITMATTSGNVGVGGGNCSNSANINNPNKTTKPKNITEKAKPSPKPKITKESNENTQPQERNKNKRSSDEANKTDKDEAQQSNEMKKLKDIELINNTRNLQQNIIHNKTTNILTATQCNGNNNTKTTTITMALDNNDNDDNGNVLKKKTTTTTTTTSTLKLNTNNGREYHSMPHELDEERLNANDLHEFNVKEHHHHNHSNSDSDSAVSSAPPSISPQPPPGGLETNDIWQMIRTYTTDIEKLQKDTVYLQTENEQLQRELKLAKEQIVSSESQAMAQSSSNAQLKELMDRVKYLEEQEHELQAESNELREQNELLEFRILELEETNDKWSIQSHSSPAETHTAPLAASSSSCSGTLTSVKDVWGSKPLVAATNRPDDPMQMLFGSRNLDSGIISPNSQHHGDEDYDGSNEEMRQRIGSMMKKSTLDDEDRLCLQQVLIMVQQMDLMTSRSGPESLNTTGSSDEASSLDMVKSRISDYSSASSSASAKSVSKPTSTANTPSVSASTHSRIVATVQPYNSSSQQQQQQHLTAVVPTNTPTDSPRKSRHSWQSNSLSESGVFVESDFFSDIASEHNACTQTDFDEDLLQANSIQPTHNHSTQSNSQFFYMPANKPLSPYSHQPTQSSPNSGDQKRLQYYKDRLELLESKVLIYESSGDLQAKRLADRLQREIQLEKELRELQDRVDFLEGENSTLEEEKCEFEEAENDTRLRLQRLEVELEIFSQRNVELEMSREALSAKYKDCRSECLILRDDLSVCETQIRHLEEDKQKAKENFEFLHSLLPALVLYSSLAAHEEPACNQPQPKEEFSEGEPLSLTYSVDEDIEMGNIITRPDCPEESIYESRRDKSPDCRCCSSRDMQYLKEEVKCLRQQIKELNSRHYEAMETADSHWVDLERDFKDREEAFKTKENCLKQKIQKLQDCLRDDARAANEKIQQLEDSEKELKCCLLRVSKEHREVCGEHDHLMGEYEKLKTQFEDLKEQNRPLNESFDLEKKRNKSLTEEMGFMRKLQTESESRYTMELEAMRLQMDNMKKEFLHIEVTNSELKEEVTTLEQQIERMRTQEREHIDKLRCLQDEVRNKEEMCQKMEKRFERSDGYSLADELRSSPSKRVKREEVVDLKTASMGLGTAITNMKDCEDTLPSHQQFQIVAMDVKKLADSLLGGQSSEELLNELEDHINEQLMKYHTRRMESEFYCTVYYPVKR